jgi:RNA polymerase sigma-70 factor (ECF subfamily)
VSVSAERAAREHEIRALCEAKEQQRAATQLLELYAREILGFLISRLRDHDAAAEAFSRFTEDMWRGLDGFRWQCSARVWCYTLARHAASHYIRDARRRRAHHVPLSHAGPISEIANRIRTTTLASARSESKTLIVRLRERLPVDDQTLLILRVNRRLAWTEIAQVMLHEGEVAEPAVLEKEAVRLRKRFQLAKDKLREMALKQGLVQADDDS